ncbi:hypothetical protein diail_4495 [Diaporthe ilicicola]|nr:hypothetical protein diail_4495 [Diaporthe ilicicola]
MATQAMSMVGQLEVVDESSALQDANAVLRAELDAVNAAMDAMLTDLEAAQASLRQEQDMSAQKDVEIDKLKKQLDSNIELLSSRTENRPTDMETSQLQQRLHDLEISLQGADRQGREQAAGMHTLETRLQDAQTQVGQLEKENKALLGQLAANQSGLQAAIGLEAQKQVEELQHLVGFYKDNWQQASHQIEDARAEQERLRQSVVVKDQQLQNQDAQIRGLRLQLFPTLD